MAPASVNHINEAGQVMALASIKVLMEVAGATASVIAQ
jgi:hypothetical protein